MKTPLSAVFGLGLILAFSTQISASLDGPIALRSIDCYAVSNAPLELVLPIETDPATFFRVQASY